MDGREQAMAYARADFSEPNRLFVELFAAEGLGRGRSRVLDLGCGPADIALRIARRWPLLEIIAVDASAAMLAIARESIIEAALENRVRLVGARLPHGPFPSHSFDAVISNSLLHHLPDPLSFWRESTRLIRPGGTIVVMDLLRPASEAAALEIVQKYGGGEPELLRRDFYNSLLASFTIEEVRAQVGRIGTRLEVRQVSDRHWAATARLPREPA